MDSDMQRFKLYLLTNNCSPFINRDATAETRQSSSSNIWCLSCPSILSHRWLRGCSFSCALKTALWGPWAPWMWCGMSLPCLIYKLQVGQPRTGKRRKSGLWVPQPWGEEEWLMWPFQGQIKINGSPVSQEHKGTNGETANHYKFLSDIQIKAASPRFQMLTNNSQLPHDSWVSSSSGWLVFNTILFPS